MVLECRALDAVLTPQRFPDSARVPNIAMPDLSQQPPVNRILVNYGEIALKGRNYDRFKSRLVKNIRHRLGSEGLDWRTGSRYDRIFVDVPASATPDELEMALAAIACVPGAVWVSPVMFVRSGALYGGQAEPDVDLLEGIMVAQAETAFRTGGGFAVRVNRADKRFPVRTQALEKRLGSAVIEQTPWRTVSLDAPDVRLCLDIYDEGAYLYCRRLAGPGGLPVGSAGHVVSLLSGGIDSPVASYLMAKRGCSMDFVHFTATRLTVDEAPASKVAGLAALISRYSQRSRLYLVPYVHFDAAMMMEPVEYDLMLFRRFMARVAETVAHGCRGRALVTGDSLGQVASQTLDNLATHSASVSMPILRPLVGFDKQEIVALARRIGTYQTSIEPYKDCCALISSNPRTSSRRGVLERIERRVFRDYAGLVQRSLDDAVVLEFDSGRLVRR